ncbi:hypothetical protein ACWQXT_12655 [Citrobacter werkmanii]|uniref:hypothetical protein n=1 Tax=Citrobacter TaxID=544 RepID=UPI001D004C4E|nr:MULTISPECIES: hypothetical protein [Citrobacter]MEC3934183.1 hypothetical protein [Citrobacter farmeri]
MATNEFKPFSIAGGANVISQAEYEVLAALSTGFTSGVAKANEINKVLRQASFIAAALAQFVSDKGNVDVMDDGSISGFTSKLVNALNKVSQPLDATLTTLAALATGADKLPYFTGEETASQTDLTSVGRDLIGKTTISDVLTYLGLNHFGYEPSTGETAIFNGNKNLRYFINNNNESGVASVDFGLLWGFDGGGKLTKGIIPVARLDGLSGSTGNSTTAVMSQKAVTDALPTVTQSTGASTTSVMSQKATTDAINAAKTTVVQSVGTSTTSVMSQNAVTSLVNDAASVGVNQLWNDVTSSRTVGINYTNTTGRPIMVAMNVKNVPSGLFASSITVQGIELSAGSTVSGEHRFISAIVPPGQVYMFQPLASSNFILLELR